MDQDDNLFSPIKSKRAFEEISSNIKKLILNNTLKPGDPLPSETELANQFQVGRQSVREALRILELSGFISIQRGYGGGAKVSNTILHKITSLMIDSFKMENITIDEITVARYDIEKCVLEHVMANADQEDFARLQENIEQAESKVQSQIHPLDDNIEFHRILAQASKNYVYIIVVESILMIVREVLSRMPPDLPVGIKSLQYHKELYQAILQKDRERAMNILKEHFSEVKERLLFLQDNPDQKE